MTKEDVNNYIIQLKNRINENKEDLIFVKKFFDRIENGKGGSCSRWGWLRWLNFYFKNEVKLKSKYSDYIVSNGIGLAFYSVEEKDIKNVIICRSTNSVKNEIKEVIEQNGMVFDEKRRYEQYREIIINNSKTFIDLDIKTGDFHKYYSNTKCMLELFSKVNGQCGNHPYSSTDINIIKNEFNERLYDCRIVNNIDNSYEEIIKSLRKMVNTIVLA